MKKILLFLLLTISVNSTAFLFADESWSSESWASLGFEYGNFFETYREGGIQVNTYTGSAAINFGGYRFFNGDKIGIFVQGLIAFPVSVLVDANTYPAMKRINLDEYFFHLQTGLLIGPGFRVDISERLKLKCAVGVGFLMTIAVYPGYIPTYGDVAYSKESWNLGIGGDVGFKFDISKDVFLSVGGIFTLDFVSYINMETSFGAPSSGWAKEFFMLGIRPYITVGTNLFLR